MIVQSKHEPCRIRQGSADDPPLDVHGKVGTIDTHLTDVCVSRLGVEQARPASIVATLTHRSLAILATLWQGSAPPERKAREWAQDLRDRDSVELQPASFCPLHIDLRGPMKQGKA